jgi:hypothetical protein
MTWRRTVLGGWTLGAIARIEGDRVGRRRGKIRNPFLGKRTGFTEMPGCPLTGIFESLTFRSVSVVMVGSLLGGIPGWAGIPRVVMRRA